MPGDEADKDKQCRESIHFTFVSPILCLCLSKFLYDEKTWFKNKTNLPLGVWMGREVGEARS